MTAEAAPFPEPGSENEPSIELVESERTYADAFIRMRRGEINPEAGGPSYQDGIVEIGWNRGRPEPSLTYHRILHESNSRKVRIELRAVPIQVGRHELRVSSARREHVLIGPMLSRLDPERHYRWIQVEGDQDVPLDVMAKLIGTPAMSFHDLDPESQPGPCLLIPARKT